ncbi:MAG TPA: substrate-binding domain-containing protein [Tepidisphaeraceae bacterium]|nr:substrate-binding domain-containing protein [Tepidisphaeraceae bacterium]
MRPSRRFLLLALISSLTLASCDRDKNKSASSDKPKPLIAVSLLTLTNPFFKEIGDTMRAEGEKRGYEVLITSGEFDPAKQKDQVKDFLVRKATAIVLCPCDSKSIGTAIIEANSAGVPVFTADIASIAPGAKVICHVATDNYDGGKLAGRAMVELLNGKGKVAILDHPEAESVMMRTKGFGEETAKAPGIQIVARLPGGGARDKSFAAAQDILQAHPDLDAIFAINDPSALGAIAAIEKAGKTGKIKIIGFDGQPEAKQAVKDGKMYATVLQHPRQIASATIEAIAKYLSGEQVPPQNLIPTALYRQADAQKDSELK